MRPTTSPPPSLIGRLEVETPEHVRLDYELAGVGSRVSAAVVDQLVLGILAVAIVIVLSIAAPAFGRGVMIVWLVTWGIGSLGYFTFFEAFRQGQTPGKRYAGIRVVRDTGHAVTFGAAFLRNLLRLADILPPPYLTGFLLVLLHPRSQRLGDLVAGTVVVRDRPDEAMETTTPSRLVDPLRPFEGTALAGPPLSDDEWRLLSAYSARAPELDAAIRTRLQTQLADRFAERYPVRPAQDGAFIEALFRTETARRAGRLGVARRGTSAVALRLAAEAGPRWAAFERLARRTAAGGLDALSAAELPAFAEQYRAVAADLARARTYRADAGVQARLERLVAAGHNQLYIDDRRTFGRIGEVILRECPAAVVRSWRAVLLALVALFGPAAGAYVTLRDHPSLAAEVLPESMLERAEAGHQRQAEGLGYFEADRSDRPVIATQIITNNVQVSFYCFAGGIFLGVGSLASLAYNGLELGATAGHFANEGVLGYLLAFIIGHGVLELFAIAVSGAAGFLLGLALLAPGDLSRREALVVRGRVAVRMVGAVVVLLIVAGSI
ncbi:MAG: stage II sporulation protein M, partial [Gemmatimonadetes bacterium]|nr:stage II sporulation protein M [Gemmatimonadota bacterium]